MKRVPTLGRRAGMGAALAMLCFTHSAAIAATKPLPSFSDYQQLLDDYLSVTSPAGVPLETRFDYARMRDLKREDGLASGIRERLDRVQRQLLLIEPRTMEPRTRLAWAINTYNFLVIRRVADHATAWKGAKPPTGVRELGGPHDDFFETPVVTIESHAYSLNDFEKAFVFPDRGQVKPISEALDPRAHFALVCGAKGCPPIQPRAFLPESLDAQLDRATRDALAGPRHLKWDPRTHTLEASEIIEWYAADFGGPDGALKFIRHYARAPVRAAIERGEVKSIARFIPWDWDLNQTPR
jgi:hypothetical protein